MKSGIVILLSVCTLLVVGYFTASKWAIRHETVRLYDSARDNRPVAVDLAVRRDKEMQGNAGMSKLPVAIISNGEGIEFTEYSFLANMFAARGYLVASIHHDLYPDDPGPGDRMPAYERGAANIEFAVRELKKLQPNADYEKLALVGHSNGADVSIFYESLHPDQVALLVTLGNSRLPLPSAQGKFAVVVFAAEDSKPRSFYDRDDDARAGISVFEIAAKNSEMTDKGPDRVKSLIVRTIDDMLDGRTRNDNSGADLFEEIIRFVFEHSQYFIAGAFIALLGVFALLVRESSLASKFFAENRKQLPHLSRYYAAKSGRSSAWGGGLILAAFVLAVADGDKLYQVLTAVLLLAVGIRYFLTRYRANRGYLGTNAAEAEELIGFIVKEYQDGTLPPDLRKLFAGDVTEIEGELPKGILEGGVR
jgi:pimeloyl-ACP methyl ester carboxylesterase